MEAFLCLLIILLPLFGFLLTGWGTLFVGRLGSTIIPTVNVGISFFCSLYLFLNFALLEKPIFFELGSWFTVGYLNVTWGFWFDSLTFIMLLVVLSISFLVHLYSIEYMALDPHLPRFMGYLSLFTFFMLILVTAHNFVQMFIGWEGVGLSSFLLINFWFTRPEANAAALKAVLVNRIGDFFITLAFLVIFILLKSFNYTTIFAIAPYFSDVYLTIFTYEYPVLTILSLLLFLGAIAKSAQLPLHTWLPSAMEGPTPVSALIHAATMVTAGVFLLARCSPLLELLNNNFVHYVVIIIGACTAFFGSISGLTQYDLKKVIAYSTCSQLGYMFLVVGLSQYSLAIFHLANHAVFKALLFLSAGSIIHAFNNEQDMRNISCAIHRLPFTYSVMLIASLALMGFPYLTGFYSKDFILEIVAFEHFVPISLAYMLAALTAFCTAFYSMRLIYFVFWRIPIIEHMHEKKTNTIEPSFTDLQNSNNLFKNTHYLFVFSKPVIELFQHRQLQEPGVCMTLPLAFLASGSICFGYFLNDLFIGAGTTFWQDSLHFSIQNSALYELEFTSDYFTLLPLLFSLWGTLFAIYTFELYFPLYTPKIYTAYIENLTILRHVKELQTKAFEFSSKKWRFDDFFHQIVSFLTLRAGYSITFQLLDRGLIELLGPYGISQTLSVWFSNFRFVQSGFIYHYISLILVGIIFFGAFLNYMPLSSLNLNFLLGCVVFIVTYRLQH